MSQKAPCKNGTIKENEIIAANDSSLKAPLLIERETWKWKFDFLIACIGASVGLGNVWRFPYLCYKNGGGAFLIPYFAFALCGGIPMFFLEVSFGQFMGEGAIGAWRRLCPLLQGIGLASTIMVLFRNIYYNVILAWILYYLFASFTSVLPWTSCNNEWNTPSCRSPIHNTTSNTTGSGLVKTDPVVEFWQHKVLAISGGIEEIGSVKWDLVLCLLLAWFIVYLCICKGIKSSGKVMYFTATSPYVLLSILLIRGCTLPGAWDGIKFYISPQWSKLRDIEVWTDAGTQVFFSYSISQAQLAALGSYNKFNHNCWRDALLYSLMNSATSLLAGFVIFPVLGFMAQEQGVSIADVAESGPGLAFIAYPKAVSQLPIAPLWSIIFFSTLVFLGLDTQFVGVEGFNTAIIDEFSNKLRRGYRREIFIGGTCILMFLMGIPIVTNGGAYIFQLLDYYLGSRILLVVALFECITVAYVYGIQRYHDNLTMMLGFDIGPSMKICWTFLTPGFSLALLVMCIVGTRDLTYNKTYLYPKWTGVLGWTLALSGVILIPILAVYEIIKSKGTLLERLKQSIRPRLEPHQLRPNDSPKDLKPDLASAYIFNMKSSSNDECSKL